ncbi:hypothetical protein Tco_1282838 [Tanacetum coccineum]
MFRMMVAPDVPERVQAKVAGLLHVQAEGWGYTGITVIIAITGVTKDDIDCKVSSTTAIILLAGKFYGVSYPAAQLIEARVSAALANHETLRNSINGHGDGSHNSKTRIRGTVRTPRKCMYKDFLNCKPLTFKGTEGVVVLSHMKTLKKMMTVKYCPRGEIKKLEIELWNLKMKGTDITSYTLRFQELALMCGCMFPAESDEVEKYVGRFPDMIRGNVMQAEQKRKLEYNAGNNQGAPTTEQEAITGRSLTAVYLEKRGSTRIHALVYQLQISPQKGHVLPDVTNARRTGHLAR